ncbi:PREDICTED: outer dense fiber protein 3-like [Ceratosolen solmsi marchali]|uniref:Outer dense fiber protein 3-like n=1 Tax=Ceratosolen solmsi marchali TaxID=326594 RepID=A0AAJ6YB38_9HYME|nr:PREDICTED: outer dense fiber protein 3-like [Ceratosolen solmsi marchali]
MPSIKKTSKKSDNNLKCNKGLTCGVVSPGPKYGLKTVVGYNNHCVSKNRNPAYTIPKAKLKDAICLGPGPKYFYNLPSIPGYSFPRAVYKDRIICSPGPKYTLPGFWSPAYTLSGRPKSKCSETIAGPYAAPKTPQGPAYPFGLKGKEDKCGINPPIRDVGPITLIKPRAPTYYMVPRRPINEICRSPGPKYTLPIDKAPQYSFGIKHNKCTLIPKTDCDDLC